MRDCPKRNVVLSILGLILFATAGSAQEAQTRGKVIREPAFQEPQSSARTRDELNGILSEWYPPTLRQVLQLDPSLLSSGSYLENYPKLAEFLVLHPEVAHNPGYFVGLPENPYSRRGSDVSEGIFVTTMFLGVTGMLIWLFRSIMGHRRWLRTTRLQTEAQAKILERFSANEDLLNFIQTPAGRRFLDYSSAPLEPRSIGAPVGRILWSVQAGLVLLFGGIGLEMLGRSSALESADLALAFLVFGGILMALGVGFLFSGLASYLLSRRFGLFDQVAPDASTEGGPAQTRSS